MNLSKPLQKLGVSVFALCAALLSAQMKCAASPAQQQEQQQSPPPPSPPTPPQNPQAAPQQTSVTDRSAAPQHKVWTNDDVVLLRTPADNYLVEKEAREAVEAEVRAKSAAQPKAAREVPSEIKLPISVLETQLLIKNKEQDISEDQATLVSVNVELLSVSEEQKKAKQKEIEIVAAELDRARNDLKALQDHLVELHRPPTSETRAAPPPPPPPPPPD